MPMLITAAMALMPAVGISQPVSATGPVAASALTTAALQPAKKASISRMRIAISGAPRGAVQISGPKTHVSVTKSSLLRLRTGKYRLHASNVTIDGDTYMPTTRHWKVTVRKGATTLITVSYSHVGSQAPSKVGNDTPPAGELGEIVDLVNQARSRTQQCGPTTMAPVDPVVYDSELGRAAQLHAEDMSAKGYFEHDSLDGRTFADRINATNYNGQAAGENIAMGFQSAEDAVAGWLSSPGHCLNIMDPEFDEMGLGFASHVDERYADPVTYWVQDFGYAPDFV